MLYVAGVEGSQDKVISRVVYHERSLVVADTDGVVGLTGYPDSKIRYELVGYSDTGDVCVVHSAQDAKIYEYIKGVDLIRLNTDAEDVENCVWFVNATVEITGYKSSVVRVFDTVKGENEYMTLLDFIVKYCLSLGDYMFGPKGFYVQANRGTTRQSGWFSDYYKFRFSQEQDAQAYFMKLFMLHRGTASPKQRSYAHSIFGGSP